MLIHGAKAIAKAQTLFGQGRLVSVTVDPDALRGAPLHVVALSDGQEAVLIDALRTPELGELFSTAEPLAAYDAKNVARVLLRRDLPSPTRWGCLMITEMLLACGVPTDTNIAALAQRYLGDSIPMPEDGFVAFAAHARALTHILNAQITRLKQEQLGRVSKVEAAAITPLAAMEHHGMPFDERGWRTHTRDNERERAQLREQLIRELTTVRHADLFGGVTLNLDNDQELRRVLRDSGHQVADMRRETLAALPPPLGPALGRYRELQKLVNAYGEGFLTHVGKDGRLHPTFEQIGAGTGRMSCRSPNLQSIVKDAPHRACFRAEDGRTLVIGDYATCELRILAEMSGDPVFAEAFARGDDLHARVASRVFQKPVSKSENPELRERAKAINFGLVYGMGAAGLARTIDAPLPQAEELLRRYFTSFPKIRGFLEHTAKTALSRGYAQTMTGRKLRLMPDNDRASVAQAERIAKNMPIQGTSADITKIALARLHKALAVFDSAWLVNCVHDEIVVECKQSDAEAVLVVLKDEMQKAGEELLTKTPVAVDVAISKHWRK